MYDIHKASKYGLGRSNFVAGVNLKITFFCMDPIGSVYRRVHMYIDMSVW